MRLTNCAFSSIRTRRTASALALFGEYQARRNEILAEYSPVFGPVEAYDVNTDGGWGWVNAPMPWETEAN